MKARGTLTRRLAGVVAALVVPLALLSACGDDSGSSAADPADTTSTSSSATPSDTPTSSEATTEPTAAPDWPACDSIWVEGQKIPTRYKGCLDGSDQVAADNLSCSSGQHIVRYADRFYGVAGGKIYETMGPLDKDKGYLKMVRTCRA